MSFHSDYETTIDLCIISSVESRGEELGRQRWTRSDLDAVNRWHSTSWEPGGSHAVPLEF